MRQAALAAAALVSLGTIQPPSAAAESAGETAGDVLRVAIPAAAFALTLRREDSVGRRQFYRSFAANVGATYLLKAAVDKDRPDGSDDDAFPSGHASMAFQGAAFIHRRYGIRQAWPAYALATLTGATRVDADEHDAADVLAGAGVGIASAFLLADRWQSSAVTFTPMLGDDTWGVTISGTF
ncbi:MAG: phosphatase PAP2 family protein [Gammaproteobacteria bacterium]|nr:phosphatase PAP2 family protein [Gammaproteobacteria bacterium]